MSPGIRKFETGPSIPQKSFFVVKKRSKHEKTFLNKGTIETEQTNDSDTKESKDIPELKRIQILSFSN